MKLLLGILVLVTWLTASASGLTLMSYNVQNLFDDVDNGSEFREFNPSRSGWNSEMFHLRVGTIAEVVRAAVPGGPDVLLLQEIENENALRTLVADGLKGMGYQWQLVVPGQGLAANVAIVSRVPVAHVRVHGVGQWKGKIALRDILEAEVQDAGHTLHLFDNHWKSKSGGVKATEGARRTAAGALSRRVREILADDPSADIIAAGDMNESVDEFPRTGRKYQTALIADTENTPAAFARLSLFLSASARRLGVVGTRLVLFDPWFEIDAPRRGSYAYQGEWLTVDHFLLSPGLFDTKAFTYRWGSFRAVRLPFLLAVDGMPKRWTGLKGERGYSDHLPLLLSLDVRP
jgi:endonuclease/exonuclease/phosphatase family metal-dependent hydrolase